MRAEVTGSAPWSGGRVLRHMPSRGDASSLVDTCVTVLLGEVGSSARGWAASPKPRPQAASRYPARPRLWANCPCSTNVALRLQGGLHDEEGPTGRSTH